MCTKEYGDDLGLYAEIALTTTATFGAPFFSTGAAAAFFSTGAAAAPTLSAPLGILTLDDPVLYQ